MYKPTILSLALLCLSVASVSLRAEATITVQFKPAPGSIENPLKGWCPYTNTADVHQPSTMGFHYVAWKELEPAEGQFAFEQWEQEKWDQPGSQGKHIVFRVYIDYPGRESGLPTWLKNSGVSETTYEQHGGGQSPDYDDPRMIAALEKMIAALGKRYNDHPRVAFIQIGLLGFWGEWHCYPLGEKLYASEQTEVRVIKAYRQAFPDKMLMVRYANETTGSLPWIGFHDDYFPDDTDGADWKFLPTLRRYGREQNWQRAAMGGELIPGQAPKWLGPSYATTKTMVDRAHFTWMGPYCPALQKLDGLSTSEASQFKSRCRELVRQMGYSFRLNQIEHSQVIAAEKSLAIILRGKNLGVAPFYYPWRCEFALIDNVGDVVARQACDWDIRQWQPNAAFEAQAAVNFQSIPEGSYRLAFGISDPWTGEPAIEFANDLMQIRRWSILSRVQVSDR